MGLGEAEKVLCLGSEDGRYSLDSSVAKFEIDRNINTMSSKHRFIVVCCLLLAAMCAIGGSWYNIAERDNQWTPTSKHLKPSEVSDVLEIYIDGQKVGDEFNGQALTLRMNHSDKVARQYLSVMLPLVYATFSFVLLYVVYPRRD